MESSPEFLSCPPEAIHPALRHVCGTSRDGFGRHRDFCLMTRPREACTRADKGDHFQVVPCERAPQGRACPFFVVVRIDPKTRRTWEALGRQGFFGAVPDSAPRADIAYAINHPDAERFADMTSAVRAAVEELTP